MSKHTPGPYLREDRTVYALEQCGWVKGEPQFRNRMSAGVQGTAPQDELESVAQLFAAAPDMYEALRAVRDELDAAWRNRTLPAVAISAETVQRYEAALAKAEAK